MESVSPNANGATSPAKNKVALITGAGSGLGRLFAQELANHGWSIVAVGRTFETLKETVESLETRAPEELKTRAPSAGNHTADSHTSADNHTAGSHTAANQNQPAHQNQPSHQVQHVAPAQPQRHLPLVCDVGDERGVEELFNTATIEFGRLDLLVNNAGIPGPTGEIHTIAIDEFDRTIRTNLRGAFLCTQQAFAWMKDHGGGRIINNGSITSTRPRAAAATYAATKAAIASLTVSTNLDGRPYGIRATELDLGNAGTELLGSFTSSEPMFDATRAAQLLASVADLPLDVCVDQLTVTAAGMPYLGRG